MNRQGTIESYDNTKSINKYINYRVLIVNDEPCQLTILESYFKTLLGFASHNVKTVMDGQEAIETVGEQNFDLIIMDLQMPGMNGFETTSKIREVVKMR